MLYEQQKHCSTRYPGTGTHEDHVLFPWAGPTRKDSAFQMRSSAVSPGCCVLNMLASRSLPFTPFIYQSGAAKESNIFKRHTQLSSQTSKEST